MNLKISGILWFGHGGDNTKNCALCSAVPRKLWGVKVVDFLSLQKGIFLASHGAS